MAYLKKNIVLCVILSIVTCGIYGIYWIYCIAKDFYEVNTPNRMDISPVLVVVLFIVTCGIFPIFAFFKWGKQTPELFAMHGMQGEDRSVLYLVLAIFGLSIVSLCLIQNDFNMLADNVGGGNYPPTYTNQPPTAPPPPPPGSPYAGQ